MENNCLVTKLNVSVNNPDIPRLNWFRLYIGNTNTIYGPYNLEFERVNNESVFANKPVILSGNLTMTQTYTSSRWRYAFSKPASGTGVIEIYMPKLRLVEDTYETIKGDISELVEYSSCVTFRNEAADVNLDVISKKLYELKCIAKGNIVGFMAQQTILTVIKATSSSVYDASALTGDISALTVPNSLTSFSVNKSAITGDISALDLTNATGLTTFELKNSPGVTGSVSAFRTLNPQITTVSFSGCNVTT